MGKFKLDFKEIAIETGGNIGGGVASKFIRNKLTHKLTFLPEYLQDAVTPLSGVILRRLVKKNSFFDELGAGLISEGGSHLIEKKMPGLAGLSDDDMKGISDKVDDVLNNILGDDMGDDLSDDMGDDGLHDDLSDDMGDDGLHEDFGDDMGDDGLHDDVSDDMGDDGLHDDMSDDVSDEFSDDLSDNYE